MFFLMERRSRFVDKDEGRERESVCLYYIYDDVNTVGLVAVTVVDG